MASTKRELTVSDQPEVKKAKVAEAEPSEPPKPKQRVVLNPADCDLDFNVEGHGIQGSALHERGFAYCWSGARANVGITGGKYCFGCKIISAQPVDMEDTPLDQQHVCRIGISRGDDAVGFLGETEHSFGYGGTGKFSSAGKFSDYGETFGVGDTVLCAVNLENKPMAFIGFSKNGKWLATVKHFNAGSNGLGVVDSPVRKLQWERALFPHVLLKNVVVQLQFSVEDGLVPEEGYKPWASALEDRNALMGPTFSDMQNCEVMMMVGLPASGKTSWAEKHVKEHPEKRYILLGTNLALDQMKVPGLLRKHNYGERFDRLMDRATGIFNILLSRASRTPRNFIIDQTNVYKSARKRKLKPFANYHKVAVVVFPKPEELKFRAEKRFTEMGKEVPAEAINEMLANYVFPVSKDMPRADEYFDQVIFVELKRADAQRHLDEMKSNICPNKGLSLYSRENSIPMLNSRESFVRPFYSTSLQNQGTFPVTGGPWRSSYSASPQSPVSSACGDYSGSGVFIPRCDSNRKGNHIGCYGCDHVRRNEFESKRSTSGVGCDSYWSYSLGGSYHSPNFESRSFLSGGGTGPCQSTMVDPYARTSFFAHSTNEGRNCLPGGPTGAYQSSMAELYARTASFPYNIHGGHANIPGHPPADQSAQMQSTFLHSTPTKYDSPYGPPPRPPYGKFSTGMQHPGGYAPPRPGYY